MNTLHALLAYREDSTPMAMSASMKATAWCWMREEDERGSDTRVDLASLHPYLDDRFAEGLACERSSTRECQRINRTSAIKQRRTIMGKLGSLGQGALSVEEGVHSMPDLMHRRRVSKSMLTQVLRRRQRPRDE